MCQYWNWKEAKIHQCLTLENEQLIYETEQVPPYRESKLWSKISQAGEHFLSSIAETPLRFCLLGFTVTEKLCVRFIFSALDDQKFWEIGDVHCREIDKNICFHLFGNWFLRKSFTLRIPWLLNLKLLSSWHRCGGEMKSSSPRWECWWTRKIGSLAPRKML